MPPALTAEQLKAIDNRRYDCVLGIERYKWPVYSESLDKAIRNTGLFKDVVWSDSGRKYDVVARVEETVHGTATIPLVAILTLGLLPSVVEEDHGHVFSLQAVDGQSERIAISTIYTGNTVLGAVAAPLWLLPSYSPGAPESTSSYSKYLSYMVISGAGSVLEDCAK
jgi:hypothetical protein